MSKQGYSSGKGSHSDGKKQSKSVHVDQLTNEQISDFQEAFRVFDRDGSGQISCKELGLVLRSLGQNPTETELQDKVNEIDTDGSGVIEFPEFLNMMAESAHQDDPEAGIREAFRVFDHNSQGYVTCDEMRFVMTNLQGALSDAEISAMLRKSDHNSDGHITYDEFARMMTGGWPQPQASTAPADRP